MAKYVRLNSVKYATTERQKRVLESLGYEAVEEVTQELPASNTESSVSKSVESTTKPSKKNQSGGKKDAGTDSKNPAGGHKDQQNS